MRVYLLSFFSTYIKFGLNYARKAYARHVGPLKAITRMLAMKDDVLDGGRRVTYACSNHAQIRHL